MDKAEMAKKIMQGDMGLLTDHIEQNLRRYGNTFVMDALVDALQAQQGAQFPAAVYSFGFALLRCLGSGAFDRHAPGNNAMKDDKGREGTS